jgi:hypothetical protein
MATRNHSRGTRQRGREGGNRPRTHPAPSVKRQLAPRLPVGMHSQLADIRLRLAIAMAVAYLTSAALKAREADSDAEAALALQRAVGDELDRQIERLDAIIAGGAS